MKVGDMVMFKQQPDPARGVIIAVDEVGLRTLAILWTGTGWDKMDGKICWQRLEDLLEIAHEG